MSVEQTDAANQEPAEIGNSYTLSANYMPCEHCGEGSLVYDPSAKTSRCNACGVEALPDAT